MRLIDADDLLQIVYDSPSRVARDISDGANIDILTALSNRQNEIADLIDEQKTVCCGTCSQYTTYREEMDKLLVIREKNYTAKNEYESYQAQKFKRLKGRKKKHEGQTRLDKH